MHRRPTDDLESRIQALGEMADELADQLQSTRDALDRAAKELAHIRRAVQLIGGVAAELPFRSVSIDLARGEARLDDVVVTLSQKLLVLLGALAAPGATSEQDGLVAFKTMEELQDALATVGPRPPASGVRTSMWLLGKSLEQGTGLSRKVMFQRRARRAVRGSSNPTPAATTAYRLNLRHPSAVSARHATTRS